MKLFFQIYTILFTFVSFSQSKNFKIHIDSLYDIKEISKLAKDFDIKYTNYKNNAIIFAKQHNLPIKYYKNGDFIELQQVVNNIPIYYKTNNLNALISTRTNSLHSGGSLGLNIEGQNMTAYIWDGGIALQNHIEYLDEFGNSRYSVGDFSNSIEFHATHVTGTIISKGIDPNSLGMMPKGHAVGFDWNSDISEITNQTLNGMLVSNHSYGNIIDSLPDYYFGAYTETSRDIDEIMYNAYYYLLVVAAGNDGLSNSSNSSPLEGLTTYDKLSSMSCAKNSLVIANANDANILNDELINVSINPSSSQGPTDDLRIKPDISGNGTQLYSTVNDTTSSYDFATGTSMASPNITGSLLLLQQLYNQLNNNYMYASTLKGLVLHTADDFGSDGPDAITGWGLLNTKKAAEVILSDGETSLVDELTLNSGSIYSTSITSNSNSKLVVSLSWTDPPGAVNTGNINDSTPVLINDLDLRLIDSNGTIFYPYRLISVQNNDLGDNAVDPFEKIIIDNPSGNYTIQISHKNSLLLGSQKFTLIVSGIEYTGVCVANAPTNLSASLLFGTANFSWANVLGATYDLRYRSTSDSNWTVITDISNESLTIENFGSGSFIAQLRSVCSQNDYSDWISFNSPPSFVLSYNSNIIEKSIKVSFTDDTILLDSMIYDIKEVNIYDLLGKELLSKMFNKNHIKIKDFIFKDEFLYIVKISLSNGFILYKKVYIRK
jgi:hypothetical protein